MKIILQIIIKEFLQFKRDPKLLGIVIIAPVFQLLILGYAANLDIDNIRVVVLDNDRTSTSREYIGKLTASNFFMIENNIQNYNELNMTFNKSKAVAGIIIPPEFEKKLNRKENPRIQIILDGSDGNKAMIALGYFQSFSSSYAKKILIDMISRTGKKLSTGSISPETRIWYNPEMRTRNYMVPSIMGMLLLIITTALMSMAIVKEREIGTLEQIIVTPIKPYQLLAGKLIPYILVAFVALLFAISVTVFWFGIEIRGSLFFLLFSSLIYLMSTLGLGLLVSTISKTQQQAMMLSMFFFLMPMIYLSGFIFPVENMPSLIQYISYIIPLKYFLIILRGIILKGIGFMELWDELLIMFLLGAGLLLLSTLRFKKRLE